MTESPGGQFSRQIEPFLNRLYRAAYRLTGNIDDAQDLVQDTCVRAFRNAEAFDRSVSRLGWLIRVQFNIFIDGTRRRKRFTAQPIDDNQPQAEAVDHLSDPATQAVTSELMDHVQLAFSRLTASQRALLALRVEGYSLAEMSEITGLGAKVIRARLHRARRSMARHVKDVTGGTAPLQRMETR